jgi:hypothetical protein
VLCASGPAAQLPSLSQHDSYFALRIICCSCLPLHQHCEWPESDPLGAFARRPRQGSVLLVSPIRLHLPLRPSGPILSDGQTRTGDAAGVVKLWINEGNLIDSQKQTARLSRGEKALDPSLGPIAPAHSPLGF